MPNVYTLYNDKPVGFKDEAKTIIELLISRWPKERYVMSITGMGGLGKTTLARRVYDEERVVNHFDVRAWCTVSQEYDYKDLCRKIYSQVCGNKIKTDDIDDELRKSLLGKRYLIVLDDIWSPTAWEKFNRVFPSWDGCESRIVITSRPENVISGPDKHIPLRFFTKEEGWDLLQVKLFKGENYPKDFQNIGLKIAAKCGGLPLVVTLVAGLLERIEKKVEKWEEFLEILNSDYAVGDVMESNAVIEHSYKHLSDHLKPCLLYFAAFPEDEEIDASYLMELWIAEGFVKLEKRKRIEDEVEDCLNHLVGSSLVIVSERKADGCILKCNVHDLVHEFCRSRATMENFFQVIKLENDSDPTLDFTSQRICFQRFSRGHPLELVPRNSSIRTLLGSKNREGSDTDNIPDGLLMAKQFEHLTILNLDFISVDKSILTQVNDSLVLLKFLALRLRGEGQVLPQSLENLGCLITLKLASDKDLHLPKYFRNMRSLRHMFIHHYCSPCMRKESSVSDIEAIPSSEILQTFLTISLSMADEHLLRKLPNLKYLSCYVRRSNQFAGIDFLRHLETLHLTCKQGHPDVVLHKFPSSIKELSLSGFTLSCSAISVIADIPNLEALKLHNCEFEDLEWNVEDDTVFLKLRYLELTSVNFEKWCSSAESFPLLEQLILKSCWQLPELPPSFSGILTLKVIIVQSCDSFDERVLKENIVKEAQEEYGNTELRMKIIGSAKRNKYGDD